MGYENAKVYKLQYADGHFYIGSTKENLPHRRAHHVAASKKFPDRRVYKHINGDWENVRIILVEQYPCENREQLQRKEDEHIQRELKNQLCLNHIRAHITAEEFRDIRHEQYLRRKLVQVAEEERVYVPRGPRLTGTPEEKRLQRNAKLAEASRIKRHAEAEAEGRTIGPYVKRTGTREERAKAKQVQRSIKECEAAGREYKSRCRQLNDV